MMQKDLQSNCERQKRKREECDAADGDVAKVNDDEVYSLSSMLPESIPPIRQLIKVPPPHAFSFLKGDKAQAVVLPTLLTSMDKTFKHVQLESRGVGLLLEPLVLLANETILAPPKGVPVEFTPPPAFLISTLLHSLRP